MQITNNISSSYNQINLVKKTKETAKTSFASMLENNIEKTEKKEEMGKYVTYLDKFNIFDSFSAEDRKIFRKILRDDKLTLSEIDSLSYEQAERFRSIGIAPGTFLSEEQFNNCPILTSSNQVKDMLDSTRKTNNKTFNEALYRTAREIKDDHDRSEILGEAQLQISTLLSNSGKSSGVNQWDWDYDNMNIDFSKFLNDIISKYEELIANPPNKNPQFIKQQQKKLDGYNIILKHFNDIKNENTRYA
ncbi:MAG: hypothetical protein CSB13_01315 [Chloroflexi bacterium]|nr:MAG: hypothetical protein CSB13_01315 [Chloroflexota bacterium]